MMLLDNVSSESHAAARDKQLRRDNELLAHRVERALREVGCHPLRELKVNVENGNVTLKGIVPTYYVKQIAQCAAMRVDDVESVDNQLIVR